MQTFLGLKFTKQNDLYQEIQFLRSVVIIPFYFLMTASRDENLVVFDEKPRRSNRKIFSLVYCPENECSEWFESVTLLEGHILAGSHKGSVEICSINRVKQILIDRIICTVQFDHPYVSSSVDKDNVSFPEVVHNIPLLGTFASEGWVLTVQQISNILANKKVWEKQLEEKWHLRMFIIWLEQSWNHMSMLRNIQSVLYFHNASKNIARDFTGANCFRFKQWTMSLREIPKTVMAVMIMVKNKDLNWFNKLNVSSFICNWFSLKCFEHQSIFYPILVINTLRFN